MIFGGRWDAPICDDAVEVATPLGQDCLWCSETVVEGDKGMLQSAVGVEPDGELVHRVVPIHRECQLRGVMGSWGHLTGTCHCYGGDTEDPPDMTVRQSALLVWKFFTRA